MEKLPEYHWWEVPRHLLTQTQHEDLDMPRQPQGPVVARVRGEDWNGRRGGLFDLYDARLSTPTRGPGRRPGSRRLACFVCDDCGARTERSVVDTTGSRCRMCRVIHAAEANQRKAHVRRAKATEWARGVLGDPRTMWVDVEWAAPLPAGEGRVAPKTRPWATVTAVDATGRSLLRLVVRRVPASTPGLPEEAVALKRASERIIAVLGGRRLVFWSAGEAKDLVRLAGDPEVLAARETMIGRLVDWRGEMDERGRPRTACLPPGSAVRLLAFTQRMAEMPEVDEPVREAVAGRRAAVVDMTGDRETVERLGTLLRALGVVLDDSVVPEAVPVKDDEPGGPVTMRVLCRQDGMPAGANG